MFDRARIGLIALFVAAACSLPNGPQEIVWDKEACAHCRMHVGDKRFAVQIQTTDGRVFNFDDPGCAFKFREKNELPIHAVWYRHAGEDRWIAEADARFVRGAETPMGFGFAAIDRPLLESVTSERAAAILREERRLP